MNPTLKQLLPKEAFNAMMASSTIIHLKPKSVLSNQEDFKKHIYYVSSGVVREFYIDQHGHDITTEFVLENQFYYNTVPYITERFFNKNLQILEDSSILIWKKEDVVALSNKYLEIASLIIQEQRKSIINLEDRVDMLRLKKPLEKYVWFENSQPALKNRVALSFIASYLNITPQTLSKIRRER